MNLIQIQENLKDLPTQAIMGYANGTNPEVPPYMALSELNRRKAMEQRSTQQPTQSVKDQLEAQVSNPPQAPQLPQGQQGIAQLPGAQGMGQAMPQGAGQGMPQMPQGAPQGMAAGGLAGLPVPDEMFNYAPGGIVAFAEGESVPEEENAGEAEAKAKIESLLQGPPAPAPVNMEDMAKAIFQRQMLGQTNIPKPMSPAEAKAEAIKQRPELAPILNSLPGGALTDLIGKLETRNQASQERFKENEGRLGLAGLSNALISAAEATRGHKGMALGEALGGFGKKYNKYTDEAVQRSEAQQALQRQYEIETAKLQSDVQSLQRAYANNDVNAIAAHSKDVAEREAKIDTLRSSAANSGLQLIDREKTRQFEEKKSNAQMDETKRQHEAQRKNWEREAANRAEQLDIMRQTKPTTEDKAVNKIMTAMPARVRGLEAKQKELEFGSDEWNQIQERIDDLYDQAYRTYGLNPPARLAKPTPLNPPEKPGFFSSLFGGSPAPKAVSFDQLPK